VSTPLPAVEHGVIVANELFDAFPVRLFEASGRGPVEVYVRWDGEQFVEARGPVVAVDDAPGSGRFEVNTHAYPAMQSLCGLVRRGAVLVFDYGYPQEELWAEWRTAGTLLCFYRHTAHEDPYVHVGEQDITAHVNFSDLEAAAIDEGFAVHGPVSQADFLLALGLGQVVDSARSDMGEYFTRRRALESLTDTAGLGRIRALAATRGIEGPLPGFEESP
jgi:SAM-dependent MidA family methyltransferase